MSSWHRSISQQHHTENKLGLGKLVQTEIDFRKKESLGLAPTQSARKLGIGVSTKGSRDARNVFGNQKGDTGGAKDVHRTLGKAWSCLVCTL